MFVCTYMWYIYMHVYIHIYIYFFFLEKDPLSYTCIIMLSPSLCLALAFC